MVTMSEKAESSTASLETIIKALTQLSPDQWADVLQFILFLQYKPILLNDATDDDALWEAVQANQAYNEQHSDESLLCFESGKDFLKATADW
jgi:hypothetical protein